MLLKQTKFHHVGFEPPRYYIRQGGNTCRIRYKSPFRNNPHVSSSLLSVCTQSFDVFSLRFLFQTLCLPSLCLTLFFFPTQSASLSAVLHQPQSRCTRQFIRLRLHVECSFTQSVNREGNKLIDDDGRKTIPAPQ